MFVEGGGFSVDEEVFRFEKIEADLQLLLRVGGEVNDNGNQITVAVCSDLAGCAVVGGNRWHINKLNLDVLERHHSGDRGTGGEGEIGDVYFCIGQGGNDRAFAGVWCTQKGDLA